MTSAPPSFVLGEHVVAVGGGLSVYGKLPGPAAIRMSINAEFAWLLNCECSKARSIPKIIKRLNKFLRKHRFGPVEGLSDAELEQIKLGQLPVGALLGNFRP